MESPLTVTAELHYQPSTGAPGNGDWFYLALCGGEVRCLLDTIQAQKVISEVFTEDEAERIWCAFMRGELEAF